MQIPLPNWVQKRPLLAAFLAFTFAVFVAIPSGIAGAWSFWSDEPFAQMARRNGLGWFVIGPYYGWFTLVVVLACAALLFVLVGISLKSGGLAVADAASSARLRFYAAIDLREGTVATLLVSVTNDGPPATFVAQAKWVGGLMGLMTGPVLPSQMKWRGTTDEKTEIMTGHTKHLEVSVFTHQKTDKGGLLLPTFHLVTPHGDVDSFNVIPALPGVATREVSVLFEVASSDGATYTGDVKTVIAVSGDKSHYYTHVEES
jgi:hypothetical protein